jgi:peptidoglycan LD-endopeptidase LytH
VLVAAVAVITAAMVPAAAQTGRPADVEQARQALAAQQAEVARLRQAAAEAEAEHQRRWALAAETGTAIEAADARLANLQAQLGELSSVVRDRAVRVYMSATPDAIAFLDDRPAMDAARVATYSRVVTGADVDALEHLEVAQDDERRTREELEELRRTQEAETAAAVAAANEVLSLLDQAQQIEDRLAVEYQAEVAEQKRLEELERRRRAEEAARAEAERRRQAAEAARQAELQRQAAQRQAEAQRQAQEAVTTVPVSRAPAPPPRPAVGTWVACPLPGAAYVDSWGAPRSGGRGHKGTDLMAARGTPNYAVVTGRVDFRNGGLGGIAAYLYGDDGTTYYYAHLSETVGSPGRVEAGTVIGLTGNSGNADGGAYHTHFEFHVGGTPVNPYPTLRANGC